MQHKQSKADRLLTMTLFFPYAYNVAFHYPCADHTSMWPEILVPLSIPYLTSLRIGKPGSQIDINWLCANIPLLDAKAGMFASLCLEEINWQQTLRRKRRMNAINLCDKRSHYSFSRKKGRRRKSRDLLYRCPVDRWSPERKASQKKHERGKDLVLTAAEMSS